MLKSIRRELRLFVYLLRYGYWDCGFATRRAWPNKPMLDFAWWWYDGPILSIHIGTFYLCGSMIPEK
jgi:hypothetical protein